MKKIQKGGPPAGRLVSEESWLRSAAKTGLPSRPICRLDFFALPFQATMQIVRTDILGTLSAGRPGGGAYTRGYINVTRCPVSCSQMTIRFNLNIRLSMLHEVEHFAKHFFTNPRKVEDETAMASILLSELSSRLDYSQQSWSALGPLHRVRRALLELTATHLESVGNEKVAQRLRYEIGDSWLRSAEVARRCGQLQEAYTLILQVKKHKNVQFFLEASQLAWDRGHRTEAITTLKKGLNEAFPNIQSAWESGDEEAARVAGNRLQKEERQVFKPIQLLEHQI